MSPQQFYETLFDIGEGVCWSTTCYGTAVYPVDSWYDFQGATYFAINPLYIKLDKAPDKVHHSPLLGRRADVNVSCYRNILVEFDNLPLTEQLPYVRQTNMPYSTRVFSGSKSMHFIISLETPFATKAEYQETVRALHAKLLHSDITVQNPSRLSRSPDAIRDNGNVQALCEVNGRVPTSLFLDWLGPVQKPVTYSPLPTTVPGVFNKFTHYFLVYGAEPGKWNRALFLAACDMTRAGLSKDETYARLLAVTGNLDKKDRATIDSAVRQATRDLQLHTSNESILRK